MREIDRFWSQVSADPALAEAFREALPATAPAEAVAAFASERGFDVSADEVRRHQAASEELSEDALDAVAGGADMPPQDPIDPIDEPEQYPPASSGDPALTDPNDPGLLPPPEEDPTKPK